MTAPDQYDLPSGVAPASKEQRAASFGRAAHSYARFRPSYPAAAVGWLADDDATTILDLGAGTGKLTALLVREGREVIAVEPSDGMRAELQRAVPGARALAGTADAIPLPNASVDAVVVAQAWHWFDPTSASHEIARVLRPGGTLGVMWNVRDDSVPWMAEFSRIIHAGETLPAIHGEPRLTAEFGPVSHASFPWTDHVPPTALRELAATRSTLITLPDDVREGFLARVDHLVATDPELAGRDEVAVPYTCKVWRAERTA